MTYGYDFPGASYDAWKTRGPDWDDEDDGSAFEEQEYDEQLSDMLDIHEALLGWQEDMRDAQMCGVAPWLAPEISEDDDPNAPFDDHMERLYQDWACDGYDGALEAQATLEAEPHPQAT